jgi:glycine C-acetyltransferase
MDGDFSSLKEITEISQKTNAITIVDDAHGDFVVGKEGKGTPEYFKVTKKIDLYISSLSKGLGSFGGYVASQNNVIDACINKSKSFIYTSALPSFLVQHSIKRIQSNREIQKKKLENNIEKISNGLKIIGDEKTAIEFGKFLFKNGVFVQPIRYPTVPKNQARLRISVTAWLTNANIEKSLKIFEKGYKKFF